MFRIDVDNINGKTESLYVFGDESILTELEAHNVIIKYCFRQGHWGSGILKLVDGEVLHQECLVPLSEGEILACQSKPTTDIKIATKD